ncbi:MAG: hypothetical protein PHC53_02885 [Patescibacteria group bacterium]|nr:hypothetical protein [Patescibacteria group bacterium]
MYDKLRGNITAFAIILVAMVLLLGIAVGVVVLEGSRRAIETDRAIGAYYMANSGIEMQLYDVRKNNAKLSAESTAASIYPGGSSWKSTTGYETSTVKTIPLLGEEELSFVDLFDPDNIGQQSNVASASLIWDAGAGGCQPDLEIGYTVWDVGVTVTWPSNAADYIIVIAPYASHLGFNVGSLDVTKAYRMRIRPLKCSAKDINVSLLDSLSHPLAYPGDITLGSEGSYQKTTQRLRVTMPRQDILSGIFSYIVFSQEQLCKRVGGAGVCP